MDKTLARASKFMSLVLRHKPEEIGLTLDPEGWARIDDLVARSGGVLTRALVLEATEKNDKRRFAISEDGARIRARQGHSVAVDLGLTPVEPPETLFHGTARRNLERIRERGLLRGERQHVHLSPDAATARKVGARHGTPVVLEIHSARMHRDGAAFYRSENGVWLTAHVPASFIGSEVA